MKRLGVLFLCLAFTACSSADEPAVNASAIPAHNQVAALSKAKTKLEKFSTPMVVQKGDWLESQPENGETFEEYVDSRPTLPTTERKTIYIQPIGKFSVKQMRVIQQAADYMRAFYNMPVVLREQRSIDGVTPDMVRVQYPNNMQIRTTYFVDQLLPGLLPADAAALLCFTNYDLYPGDTWNYVFGQASFEKRVGVWSLWRLERDGGKRAKPDHFLDRTLKIAMHETGHMFSMRHCIKYECLMSGTNHLDETDRRPLDTCSECTMKIAWAMKYGPAERYKNLAGFWSKQGRQHEEKRMLEKGKALE